MKHSNFLRIFFDFGFGAFIIMCCGCYNGQNIKRIEITDTATLRREILRSIAVPFEQVDTVILCETSGVVECGNLTEAEIAGLPKPCFEIRHPVTAAQKKTTAWLIFLLPV